VFSQNPDAPRPDRVKLAEEHIKSLEPRLTRVRVSGPDANASLVVKVDGVAYERAAWAGGILVDPGKHTVSVAATGKRDLELPPIVVDAEGANINVTVPRLADAAEAPRPGGMPHEQVRPYRTAGIIVGAAGLATVATGAVFGVLTITTNNDAKNKCLGPIGGDVAPSKQCYSPSSTLDDANRLHDRARQFGTVSTVLFPVGLVAAGLGAYLFVHQRDAAQPGKSAMSARVVASPTGMFVEGQF
jgi:hypothetical protein